MSKILFITNIANKIGSFSIGSINAARNTRLDFYMAAHWNATREEMAKLQDQHGVHLHHIDLARSPLSSQNIVAYKQLVKLIRDENIDYIHCNTPVGGILGRLAGKKCKVKRVIYQAHGFHFYKGAPLINWLLYYPVEKWLAHYTDALITINQEDYELAQKRFKLRKGGKVYYVPGVGIDTAQYRLNEKSREGKRLELGLGENDVALISMGDLIKRKNYDTAIRAIAKANIPTLQYFICGKGPEEENLKVLARGLGVDEQIHFLGFRSDIKELLSAADVFLFTTRQEGLPRSMMEAMAVGLPCVASRIRGNTDLLDGNGGFLCNATDVTAFAEKINLLAYDVSLREEMGKHNLLAIRKFSSETVQEELQKIYISEF